MSAAAEDLTWQRSRLCASTNCVEVALDGDVIHLRSSRAPDKIIELDHSEWAVLKAALRDDEF